MRFFVDCVFTTVEDASYEEKRVLRECLRFFNPSLEQTREFKEGLIDGYEDLFFEDDYDTFYSGLLAYVLFQLKPWGITPEISYSEDYKTPTLNVKIDDEFNGKVLRDYQKDAIKKALIGKRGVLQIPTGGGKTTCAIYLTKLINQPTLFTVNTSVLAVQTALSYRSAGFERVGVLTGLTSQTARSLRAQGVTLFQDVGPDEFWDLDVIVPVIHSLRNAVGQVEGAYEYLQERVKVYFADEAHGVPAKIWQALTAHCNAPYRIALSATPYDDSLHPNSGNYRDRVLQGLFGARLCFIPIDYLHSNRVLPRPELYMVPVPPADSANDWHQTYKHGISEHAWRNNMIAAMAIQAMSLGKKVFISVLQKVHGKTLLEMISAWVDKPVYFAHGGETILRYCKKSGSIKPVAMSLDTFHLKLRSLTSVCLIGCTNYDQGVDLPDLDFVIYAGGRKKLNRVLQRVGRGIRPKDKIVVADFLDQGYSSLHRHSLRRLQIYQEVGWPVFQGPPPKSAFIKEGGN